MDGICFDPAIGNDYANKELKLDYEVTAVQVNNSEAAMAAEWGMFPAFDEEGTLIGVYETEAEAQAAAEAAAREAEAQAAAEAEAKAKADAEAAKTAELELLREIRDLLKKENG